jgi:ribonuclease P protein component
MGTSKSLHFGDLSFKYTKSSKPKMGLIVSRKYGNAIERNLFKRRCRSAFKSIMVDNNMGCVVVVRPKKPDLSFGAIQESFNSMYDKFSD